MSEQISTFYNWQKIICGKSKSEVEETLLEFQTLSPRFFPSVSISPSIHTSSFLYLASVLLCFSHSHFLKVSLLYSFLICFSLFMILPFYFSNFIIYSISHSPSHFLSVCLMLHRPFILHSVTQLPSCPTLITHK